MKKYVEPSFFVINYAGDVLGDSSPFDDKNLGPNETPLMPFWFD